MTSMLSQDVITKACSKCGEVKALSGFYKDKRWKFGVRSSCKACDNEQKRKYHEKNRDIIIKQKRKYREENLDEVREREHKYREESRDKLREKQRKYREKNLDKVREINRKYREKNLDKVREINRKYREKNLDKARERERKYREENKHIYNYLSSKRRAAKKNRTPLWVTDEHKEIMRLYYETRQSLTEATGIEYHVDHIIPLQGENVSGLHVPENLQIIPAEKNMSKSNRW